MDISVAKRAALVLACLVLFSTCGELETLLPSNGTYQIKALVNGTSLEECALIRTHDKIYPYFANSVTNDPDLIGLLVYLQDSRENIVGVKVQYTLPSYAAKNALTEEALAELEISVFEEKAKELGTSEPETEAANDIPEQKSYTDVEIVVKSLSQKLPYLSLPKDLEIGPYTLVFETVGKRDILSHMETNIYYIGSAEFNLKDISMYLPGLSGPQLISPATAILLEASLDFDSRLDPYVIWYNGKNIINEGKISEGAGQLLWKAPEQPGFYSLRLEALPFPLKRGAYNGVSREIALPVSPKAISLSYFFQTGFLQQEPALLPEPALLQWYQFEGNLRDSLSTTLIEEQNLLPVRKTIPRWAAAGQSYGLAIGPADPYLLPPVNFFHEETNRGGGTFLLHIKPLSEGNILSAFFPLQSPETEGISMNIIKKDNAIALRLAAADISVELPVYLALPITEGFIPVAVEFHILPNSFKAMLSMDNNQQSQMGEIILSSALSGEGKIILGSNIAAAQKPNEETFAHVIWDELAILYSGAPLPQRNSLETIVKNENNKTFLTDTDIVNSIEEQETQEREAQGLTALTVISEDL